MILDANFSFTGSATAPGNNDNRTDSPTTGTQTSSKIIDLHIANAALWAPILANLQGARDMGIGDDPSLKLLIEVTTTFLSGTSLTINLQAAPDNGSGAPGTFATWYTTGAVAEASLVAPSATTGAGPGTVLLQIDLPRPPAGVVVPRFFQLQYVTSGTHTAGAIYAGFVLDREDQMYSGTNSGVLGGYPAGINIAN